MDRGYIHIYTGNGKGKTTAALGLAIRAAGAGKKVFIGQFVKGMEYSELNILKDIPNISLELLGKECFIEKAPSEEDIRLARQGLDLCRDILSRGDYDLVILDEITIALYFNLFELDEVIDILKNRAPQVEVVLTGRYADDKLIEMADLVSEMKEIKHYYSQGLLSRQGIDC